MELEALFDSLTPCLIHLKLIYLYKGWGGGGGGGGGGGAVTDSLILNESLENLRWLPIMPNNCCHKTCLCYIINYFGATNFVTHMPKQTVSNSHVGVYDKYWR